MQPVEFAIFLLAVFGFSYTMTDLHGPFGLCQKFRRWVRANTAQEWILTGIECPICMSFTVSLLITSGFVSTATWEDAVLLVLSGVGFTAVVMMLAPPGQPPFAGP